MVEPDAWIPRLINGERGLLEEAEKVPNYVNPDYEDLDDMFMYADQIPGWSQAPSSNVVIEKPDSSKKNSEVNNAAKGKRYKVCANRKAFVGVKFVEPRDEVPTQASRAHVAMDKGKGKRKMETEVQTGDSDSEDEEFGESGGRGGNNFEDVYGPDGFEETLTEVSEDGPYEKNDLRKKAAVKAKDMKNKRAAQKAAANATTRGTTRATSNKGRPLKPPNASSTLSQSSQASSRVSMRLRAKNAGK